MARRLSIVATVVAIGLTSVSSSVSSSALETTVQPNPVIPQSVVTCPTDAPEGVTAKLKFRTQQSVDGVTRVLSARSMTLLGLGWEWGDHVTYFPVKPGLELTEAFKAFHQHQEAYLASLIEDLSKVLKRYEQEGDELTVNNLRSKIKLYETQLEHVRTHPIKVAFVKVLTTNDEVSALAEKGEIFVMECVRIVNGRPSVTPTPTQQNKSISTQDVDTWAPSSGTIIVRDNTLNNGPYIRNFIQWRDVSGFDSVNFPGYEHDVKLSASFTECREVESYIIGFTRYIDCEGPWGWDFPAASSPYLDTRALDNVPVDGKDFTIGVGKAYNLATNTVYTTTVYTLKSEEDSGWVKLASQRMYEARRPDEVLFCDLYSEQFGYYAACYFVDTSMERGTWTVENGEQNWFDW